MKDLCERYGERLLIRIIDPQSGLGLWKSVRHWIRRYPTFIVNGRRRYTGWDKEELEAILHETLAEQEIA